MLGEYVKEYISKLTTVGIMHRKGIELKRRDYDELQELLLYSTKELDELIKASEERDTLKAKHIEYINASIGVYEGYQKQIDELKQDALLGKALKKAFEYDFEVYKSQGCIVVETNTHDIELLDWYQQQLEKEETSGK